MLLTNHVLAGALVGRLSGRRSTAVVAGVASHAVLDVSPHYRIPEHRFMTFAVCDGLLALAVSGALLARTRRGQRLAVAAAIFGACLPDLDKPGRHLFGRSPFPAGVDRLHARIQTELPHLAGVELAAAAGLGVAAWTLLPRHRPPAAVAARQRVAVSPRG
ncbi:MAG TPA: hypothetical protein VI248_08990 [Kineosporiaceae bacterium]